MMNPRYLQRFGDPQPFRDSIARAALRYDPDAVYGEPELGDSDGQRLFDPPDFQPSMNKGSLVATPSTAQMAADMTPNVYRPENGEPYTNTGAPWHQGQLPAVPHGDLLVSSSPLDERTNPIPGGAGYNYASEMASSAPMSQPPVTAPPSAPIEHPIVRNQRERAELEAAGGGSAQLTEQPSRSTTRGLTPSPEAATAQTVPPPPAIDTRKLPTEAPPESTIAKLIRQRLENKEPERGPVSKWAKLAAVALGAGQGYYNAANPNARPIDASEAVQNLTLGRKYIDAMGKYQRTNKNLDEQIKLVGEAEERTEAAASRKTALARQIRQDDLIDKDRDEAHALGNLRLSLDLANQGFKNVVDPTVPAAPGVIRFSNPMDKTGKGFVEGTPTKGTFTVTDPAMAKRLNGKPGMEIPWAVLDKLLAFDQAVEVATIQAGSKQPTKLDPDVILLEEAKNPGTHSPAVIIEARRQRSENHRPPAASQPFGDGEYSERQLGALTRLNESVSRNATFAKTAAMKNYNENVKSALFLMTGVGDIAAINQFQKVIDEGAVTRDQDVRLIQGSQSLLNSLRARVSKLEKGEQLSPTLRQQMIAATDAMYQAQLKTQAKDPYLLGKMKEAKRYGLKLEDTILGGMGDQSAPAQNAGPGRSGEAPVVGGTFNGGRIKNVTRIN